MTNDTRYMWLKALSLILLAIFLFLFVSGDVMSQYTFSILGAVYALAYAHKKATNKVMMLVVSILLLANYMLVNVSILDALVWGTIMLLVGTEKAEEKNSKKTRIKKG